MTKFSQKLTRHAIGLLKSTHPIPSFAVTLLTVLLGVSYLLSIQHLVFIGLCVLAQQFSVGLSNDWLDHQRDKSVSRQDKPTATGEVSVKLVRNASFAAGIAALAFASIFGWVTVLMMVMMLTVGWSYNLGLKATGFSVIPYAIGFGILPLFVTLTFENPQLPPWWVVLASSLLGVSAHFANALPDLLEDRRTGVCSLPHIMGQRASALTIATAATLASIIVVTQSPGLNLGLAVSGFVLTVGLSVLSSVLALRSEPPRLMFYLLLAASFVNVFLLVLGQLVQ